MRSFMTIEDLNREAIPFDPPANFICLDSLSAEQVLRDDQIGVLVLTRHQRDGSNRVVFIHPSPQRVSLARQFRDAIADPRVLELNPDLVWIKEVENDPRCLQHILVGLMTTADELRRRFRPEVE